MRRINTDFIRDDPSHPFGMVDDADDTEVAKGLQIAVDAAADHAMIVNQHDSDHSSLSFPGSLTPSAVCSIRASKSQAAHEKSER